MLWNCWIGTTHLDRLLFTGGFQFDSPRCPSSLDTGLAVCPCGDGGNARPAALNNLKQKIVALTNALHQSYSRFKFGTLPNLKWSILLQSELFQEFSQAIFTRHECNKRRPSKKLLQRLRRQDSELRKVHCSLKDQTLVNVTIARIVWQDQSKP